MGVRKPGAASDTCFNAGFFAFLLPTLRRLAAVRTCACTDTGAGHGPIITRLWFSDEQDQGTTTLSRLSPADAPAFSSLTHLDLCIAGLLPTVEHVSTIIETLSGAAATLMHLRLCRERCVGGNVGRVSVLRVLPHMPRLVSLHIDDIPLRRRSPKAGIGGLCAAPCRDAKAAVLVTRAVTAKEVLDIAALKNLQLDRFVLLPADTDDDDHPSSTVYEPVLLDLINRGGDGPQHGVAKWYGLKLRQFLEMHSHYHLRTHPAVWDVDGWETAAIMDHRAPGWRERGYAAWEVLYSRKKDNIVPDQDGRVHSRLPGTRIRVDGESGLWKDQKGNLYDPVCDREVRWPIARADDVKKVDGMQEKGTVDDGHHWTQGDGREWDFQLGLWRNLTGFHRFAVDRAQVRRRQRRDGRWHRRGR